MQDKPLEEKPLSRSALRRIREKEQRYNTILKAAEELFVKNGYHATSVGQVADLAEVSVGTVYFYFKNKDDLLIQLFKECVMALRIVLGSAFLNESSSIKGFEKAGLAFFDDFCINHREKFTILFKEAPGLGAEVEEYRKVMLEDLISDVQGALTKVGTDMGFKNLNEHTTRVVTVGILGIYERVAYQYLMWQDGTGSPDLSKIGRDAVSFIMGGVHSLKG